ncbi:hypothetical protein [Streptomyces sp. NPDC001020]
MNHLSRDTPNGGLDDTADTERPWTTTIGVTPGKPCSAEGPRVVVEYITVDGEDARALAQRQGAAIREVLEWLYARHSTPPESGQAGAGRPEPPRT